MTSQRCMKCLVFDTNLWATLWVMSIQSSSFHDLIQCISLLLWQVLYSLSLNIYDKITHVNTFAPCFRRNSSESRSRTDSCIMNWIWAMQEVRKKTLWLVHVSIRLSVFMPLGHPNLKQDVACNQNYSISNFKSIWHEESEGMMGWWDEDSRIQTAWSHVVGHDTQRHGVQDPHLKNSRLKPKTRTSVQPWSKSLIQSRRLLIVW